MECHIARKIRETTQLLSQNETPACEVQVLRAPSVGCVTIHRPSTGRPVLQLADRQLSEHDWSIFISSTPKLQNNLLFLPYSYLSLVVMPRIFDSLCQAIGLCLERAYNYKAGAGGKASSGSPRMQSFRPAERPGACFGSFSTVISSTTVG